jgi:hypothetical protein
MFPVALAKMFAPSVGSALTGIASDILQKGLGSVGRGGLPGANPLQLFGNLSSAFDAIFGKKPSRPHVCHPHPLPFSPTQGFPLNNPFGALRPAINNLQQMGSGLENVMNVLQGRPFNPASGASQFGDFGRIDTLMDQAKALMNKENPSQKDLMQAQELMSRATTLSTLMSNIMSAFFQTQKSIAGNIRP